ncbi:MAG: hypothetical protein JKY94_09370 [Rhodobacteraceae bacterium]|nr:hypothetical protein [Paracoccaceae bacterium]
MDLPPKGRPSDVSRPSLSIDWEVYAAMLEDSDMPLEQQKELIETLWSIVVMFVDLGFDLSPVQQICGEADDLLSDVPPDIVSLCEKELEQRQHEEDR